MASQANPFPLFRLPAELRLRIYHFYLLQPEPVHLHIAPKLPAAVLNLWHTCRAFRREAYHASEDYLKINTVGICSSSRFHFGMALRLAAAPWNSRVWVQKVRITHICRPYLRNLVVVYGSQDLSALILLPNLRCLELDVGFVVDTSRYAERGLAWTTRPLNEREEQYSVIVQSALDALPLLPDELVLQITGAIKQRRFRRGERHRQDRVKFSLTYRYDKASGWQRESVEETYRGALLHGAQVSSQVSGP